MDAGTATVLAAFTGSGALATVVAKFFRPPPTLTETVEQQAEEIERIKLDASRDRGMLLEALDYIHALRGWIGAGKPPPPPPFPERLKQ